MEWKQHLADTRSTERISCLLQRWKSVFCHIKKGKLTRCVRLNTLHHQTRQVIHPCTCTLS